MCVCVCVCVFHFLFHSHQVLRLRTVGLGGPLHTAHLRVCGDKYILGLDP